MSEIGIVANPHSKLNRRSPNRAKTLSYILGEKGHFRLTQSLGELDRVLVHYKEKNIKILGINGGDGTVSRTLSSLIKVYGDTPLPKIAILKGGTINMLARNLGIKGSSEEILTRLTALSSKDAREVPTRSLRCLNINNNYGFLFGNGVVPAFLDEFYRNKTNSLGAIWLLLKVLISGLFSGKLYQRIICDHEVICTLNQRDSIHSTVIATLVSTTTRMPLGPKFFPETATDKSIMKAYIFTGAAKNASFWVPFTTLLRPSRSDSFKQGFLCKSFSMRSQTLKRYTLDGEIFDNPSEETEIQLGPVVDFLIL